MIPEDWFMERIRELMPSAEVWEDYDGQIVINTGLANRSDGTLEPIGGTDEFFEEAY